MSWTKSCLFSGMSDRTAVLGWTAGTVRPGHFADKHGQESLRCIYFITSVSLDISPWPRCISEDTGGKRPWIVNTLPLIRNHVWLDLDGSLGIEPGACLWLITISQPLCSNDLLLRFWQDINSIDLSQEDRRFIRIMRAYFVLLLGSPLDGGSLTCHCPWLDTCVSPRCFISEAWSWEQAWGIAGVEFSSYSASVALWTCGKVSGGRYEFQVHPAINLHIQQPDYLFQTSAFIHSQCAFVAFSWPQRWLQLILLLKHRTPLWHPGGEVVLFTFKGLLQLVQWVWRADQQDQDN